MNYVYDGDGNRLYKATGSTPNKVYWYGAGTEILDESDASGNITNEYVFFGGKRIAMDTVTGTGGGSIGTTYYYAEDFLGSSRAMVQAGATTPCFDGDFLPFGREKDAVTTCNVNSYKFEGKERDAETGNDDFGARYYSSNFGRWLSPDWSSTPEAVPYANLTNPQTLNLYAMVEDDPESFADLDGHVISGDPKNGYCNVVSQQGCNEEDLGYIFDAHKWGIFDPQAVALIVNLIGQFDDPYAYDPAHFDPKSGKDRADAQAAQSALNNQKIVTASFTSDAPGILAGGAIGELIDPLGGGVVGAIVGSRVGTGVDVSYVPSTYSWFAGLTVNVQPGSGTGASVSFVNVPANQDPNKIANGFSVSLNYQPNPLFGSVITKSPGSGPPVVGPAVGTRVPFSASASYNFNITPALNAVRAAWGNLVSSISRF